MPDRYFVREPITGERAHLTDEEAHHLSQVMRAQPGDEVILFDGSGAEWHARVETIGRSSVGLRLLIRHETDRELPCQVTLAVALPKGDRQRWLVEKAVELGVHRLTPLTTERGVAEPVDKALARLRRAVIEASKQCRRNRLLEITAPLSALHYFASPAAAEAARALADPSGQQHLGEFFAACGRGRARSLEFAIGPEGGFSAAELAAAVSHDWPILHLGPRILRVETAAVYVAAAAAHASQTGVFHLGQAT
ncbi:MAG TPA: 16S rRNA (uracil(1498)-N(3))-methyltransferase [Pirellulales bacterium]|nr:16S rRNA (uracil(1498)-N(3))-methyltransferase [Pirellulales bacterium]